MSFLKAIGSFGAVVLTLFAGCAPDDIRTDFPPGLEPLDADNKASYPEAEGDDVYPERLNAVSGEADDYDWVATRGYVHASLEEAWEAIRSPEVSRDHTIDDWRFTRDSDPAYDYTYTQHYTVHDLITISFDVSFRHSAIEGRKEKPLVVAGRYKKIFGTSYITLLDGSIVARKVDDHTTAIELIEHLDATATGTSSIENYLREYYGNIVAAVHGNHAL
mgnify:CR=1 FL=1